MARRATHLFIGSDNYISVSNVTLRKTFSLGVARRKCVGNVSLLRVPQQPERREESEGKSWILLAFLMSRRHPFSSAKINIWPSVASLCLIRGHPGLHIQELIDPENFIQSSNSRPEQLCSPSSRLFLAQMLNWHWNYLLIKETVVRASCQSSYKTTAVLLECTYFKEVISYFF